MDYSIAINQERHGLCIGSTDELLAALLKRIDEAVAAVEQIRGVTFLESTNQELEDGLILQFGSQPIKFEEPQISPPMTDERLFTVKQTRYFTGDPALLGYWPCVYRFEPPFGKVNRIEHHQKGYIEVNFSLLISEMGNPPTEEETLAAFAKNDGKLLKLPEWVNSIAKTNNEQMRQKVSVAVAQRKQRPAV